MAVVAGIFRVWSLNAARIVYVVDEPRRFGCAYETLPGHVERGEERFLIEITEGESVVRHPGFLTVEALADQDRLSVRASITEAIRSRVSGGDGSNCSSRIGYRERPRECAEPAFSLRVLRRIGSGSFGCILGGIFCGVIGVVFVVVGTMVVPTLFA